MRWEYEPKSFLKELTGLEHWLDLRQVFLTQRQNGGALSCKVFEGFHDFCEERSVTTSQRKAERIDAADEKPEREEEKSDTLSR